MSSEKDFVSWIKRELETCDVVKIESSTSRGIPDLNVASCSKEIWIEAKVCVKHRVLLRPEQYAWGMRRAIHGGRVFVVALEPQRGLIFIWRYPHITVEPLGKYVAITNSPSMLGYKNDVNLGASLFT